MTPWAETRAQETSAPSTLAQTENAPQDTPPTSTTVSEAELEQFAHALVQVKIVEQRAILSILEEIKRQGFSEERFNAIVSAPSPESLNPPLTTAEQEKLTAINAQVEAIEAQALTQMTQAVVNQGLTYERYQAILATVRQQPELKERAQQLVTEIVGQLREN
ncbi:MAG: DUF4168 domain-containing protein [Spirulina sp. SIO3F2]|nr:DUF4168 domain-containing protein [Spirulina sp. SIO3F2]